VSHKARREKIVMMSDLVKAQIRPQFNWYTCCEMSLGANGTPDKLIKEGLKQPYKIKISLGENTKEITVMLHLTRLNLAQSTF
jgi:hypothetical protein